MRIGKAFSWILILLALVIAGSGCASRKEIVQFQSDHQEFRARLESLDSQQDTSNERLERIEVRVDTLVALLGGNVNEYLQGQEDLLRAMRADQQVVSEDLERLIVTLSSRVVESEERIQKLLIQLDTFNQLVTQVLGDSLASAGMDATEAERLYQQSFSDYMAGEYEVARMGFTAYVEQFPTLHMADDALYWASESWLSEEHPDSAEAMLDQLEARFPDSEMIAQATLKRAIIRLDRSDLRGAKRLFERVVSEFPDSDEADQAAIRLSQLPEVIELELPPSETAMDSSGTEIEVETIPVEEGSAADTSGVEGDL